MTQHGPHGKQVWRKLVRNPLAAVSLCVIALMTLVALLGYLVLPDASSGANRQLPALAKSAMGSQATVLRLPLQSDAPVVSYVQRWWQGDAPTYSYVPIQPGSLRWQADTLHYAGPDDQPGMLHTAVTDTTLRTAWLQAHTLELTFWLGTDALGRDLLSRLLLGTRISMGVGLLAVFASLLLGVTLGTLSGYYGGRIDAAIQWFMSVVWSLPSLLLALVLAFALGKGLQQLVLAIALSIWVDLARVVRGQVMALRQRQWVQAAQVLGLPAWRIMLRHILPNLSGTIIILSCANFATAILLEAGLSFLGLGVPPPTPSWGSMVQEGYSQILFANAQWLAFFPGMAIVMLIMCLNLVAMALRDAMDPTS